ncbi:thioesterase [Emticicia aquatilis]|uniref:Thioesterase n=1 Tax=Emticicia aquatilis TaxID=1537369 RepID=A0A916Z685_9BACT|nr:thioesterase family protein [Emticicia aquatilis]GGD77905.1 thioesterase [Emticicia aquatilis]
MPHVFYLPITVAPDDIDELNHVNNIVYLRYVQDAAIGHWKTVPQEIASQIIWMARRHEIDYLKQAFLGEELVAKTWVDDFVGVKSIRHCEIMRGEEILARSVTHWISLDAQTLRPKRITEEIVKQFFPESE